MLAVAQIWSQRAVLARFGGSTGGCCRRPPRDVATARVRWLPRPVLGRGRAVREAAPAKIWVRVRVDELACRSWLWAMTAVFRSWLVFPALNDSPGSVSSLTDGGADGGCGVVLPTNVFMSAGGVARLWGLLDAGATAPGWRSVRFAFQQVSWRRCWWHVFAVWTAMDVALGDPGVGGALAVAVPRSCSGGFVWWRHVFPRVGQVLESPRCGVVERFRAKALCFGTNDGDARGCRIPLRGVVEVPLTKPGLRVKTLDRFLGLDGGDTCVVSLLRASSWSPGSSGAPRRHRRAFSEPDLELPRL